MLMRQRSRREQLRSEFAAFPWKAVLPRMAMDVVLVNASFVVAFVLWFFFYLLIVGLPEPALLAHIFKNYVAAYWLLWSGLALLIFHVSGFYTRARGYAGRYKVWVIFRAVGLFMVLFVFIDYFLFRSELLPRGVAALGWLLMLASVGGIRLAKDFFLKGYNVVPQRPPRKPQTVLVIGGAGYLGSVLVRQLLARGYKVRVLDSLLFGRKSLDPVMNDPGFELIVGDIRDIQAVVQAMKGCDAVIHLAAIVGDPACEENRPLAVEVNRAATQMAMEISRGYGVTRFLFASSCSVYGASDSITDEHSALAPLSTYAQTKIDSEGIVLASKSPDFYPTVLRLSTLFGASPRMRFDLVVNLLTGRAFSNRKITIFNGSQWRPFMHTQDAARALIACLEASPEVVSGQIFNAGDNTLNHQLSDIADNIQEIMPHAQIEPVENQDRRNYRVSFDKIRGHLRFTCQWTLKDGIHEIHEMLTSGQVGDFTAEEFSNLATIRVMAQAANATGRSSLHLLESLARYE